FRRTQEHIAGTRLSSPGSNGRCFSLESKEGGMKSIVASIIGLVCILLAAHAAAQIIFYENEGFRGRTFTANRQIDNFANVSFNDGAASAIVERGNWEICEHASFQGRCATLQPGQYPSLGPMGLNRAVSSVRPVRGRPHNVFPSTPATNLPYTFFPH